MELQGAPGQFAQELNPALLKLSQMTGEAVPANPACWLRHKAAVTAVCLSFDGARSGCHP